jgi:hypothetical protein
MQLLRRSPIMFFRPQEPQGSAFLQVKGLQMWLMPPYMQHLPCTALQSSHAHARRPMPSCARPALI